MNYNKQQATLNVHVHVHTCMTTMKLPFECIFSFMVLYQGMTAIGVFTGDNALLHYALGNGCGINDEGSTDDKGDFG